MDKKLYQLRTYYLADLNSAETYYKIHWKRHLISLPKFGINVEKVFYSKEEPKVIALVYYDEGIDAKEANEKYMKSQELRDDMEGFDMKKIIKVDELFLWQ